MTDYSDRLYPKEIPPKLVFLITASVRNFPVGSRFSQSCDGDLAHVDSLSGFKCCFIFHVLGTMSKTTSQRWLSLGIDSF